MSIIVSGFTPDNRRDRRQAWYVLHHKFTARTAWWLNFEKTLIGSAWKDSSWAVFDLCSNRAIPLEKCLPHKNFWFLPLSSVASAAISRTAWQIEKVHRVNICVDFCRSTSLFRASKLHKWLLLAFEIRFGINNTNGLPCSLPSGSLLSSCSMFQFWALMWVRSSVCSVHILIRRRHWKTTSYAQSVRNRKRRENLLSRSRENAVSGGWLALSGFFLK